MAWLEHYHPYLVRRYERLYAEGAYTRSGTSAGSPVRSASWPRSTASVPRARGDAPQDRRARETAEPVAPATPREPEPSSPCSDHGERPLPGVPDGHCQTIAPGSIGSRLLQNEFFRGPIPGRCGEGRGVHGSKSSVLGRLCEERAAALCGAAAVLAGMITSIPADASAGSATAPRTTLTTARPTWKPGPADIRRSNARP